jgi:hypothetical protein
LNDNHRRERVEIHCFASSRDAAMYFPCRWYAGLKARRSDWWLRYT